MAAVTWRCPVCERTSPVETMCRKDLVPYVRDLPEPTAPVATTPQPQGPPSSASSGSPVPEAAPGERLALRTPWRQQINLPDQGSLVIGRSMEAFKANAAARARTQISRVHARVFREADGSLHVQDLGSLNGTSVGGESVEGENTMSLRAGQTLRLGQDVDFSVIRLNEFGEPEESGDGESKDA